MKVLILEDDPLLQIDLADTVADLGYQVIGPFRASGAAMTSCDEGLPDAAILDFNLGADGTSAGFARRLMRDGVRFTFLTAHARQHLPPDLNAVSVIEKPFDNCDLERFLKSGSD